MSNIAEQIAIAGNVGREPEVSKDGRFLSFSVAIVSGWDKEAKQEITRWVAVSIWNDTLKQMVRDNIKKGNRVVVLGRPSHKKLDDGREFFNLSASRVGLVEYLRPAQQDAPPANEGSALGW